MNITVKKRIYCFDLLKIISILIVFSHHIMMDMYVIHPMHNLKILETLIVRPNMNLGMIACGMFILISGATLALKGREEEPIAFYKKRLLRLLIPFYIAYIIYFVIRVINARSIHIFSDIPIWRFIFTIIGMDEYLSANGIRTFSLGVGEWFLGCILLCYLVYPFLYKVHKKNNLIAFIAMTIYFVFINLSYGRFNFVIPSYMNFLCQVYNFYLGIVLIGFINDGVFGNAEKPLKNKYLIFILLLVIVLFFYFYMKMILIPDNFKTTIVLISLFILFYFIEDFISSIGILRTFTIFFNKISLEIYLVHHFVIYQVDYMLGYRSLSGIKTLCVIMLDLVIIILLAILVERLSGKITKLVYKTNKK